MQKYAFVFPSERRKQKVNTIYIQVFHRHPTTLAYNVIIVIVFIYIQ